MPPSRNRRPVRQGRILPLPTLGCPPWHTGCEIPPDVYTAARHIQRSPAKNQALVSKLPLQWESPGRSVRSLSQTAENLRSWGQESEEYQLASRSDPRRESVSKTLRRYGRVHQVGKMSFCEQSRNWNNTQKRRWRRLLSDVRCAWAGRWRSGHDGHLINHVDGMEHTTGGRDEMIFFFVWWLHGSMDP